MDNFWEVLLWSLWFFVWIAALMVWFRCIWDLFSDSSLGGWGKAGWVIVLIFLPWLGALIYLIARGRGMGERQYAAALEAQQRQAEYIQKVAGGSKSSLDELAQAKSLLDSGVLTQAEFDAVKAKALA